jgi:hypothetical protein
MEVSADTGQVFELLQALETDVDVFKAALLVDGRDNNAHSN